MSSQFILKYSGKRVSDKIFSFFVPKLKVLDLYVWLSFRLEDSFPDRQLASSQKAICSLWVYFQHRNVVNFCWAWCPMHSVLYNLQADWGVPGKIRLAESKTQQVKVAIWFKIPIIPKYETIFVKDVHVSLTCLFLACFPLDLDHQVFYYCLLLFFLFSFFK